MFILIPEVGVSTLFAKISRGCSRVVPPKTVSETNKATDGVSRDLNIGATRVWRLDETGQIYNPEGFGLRCRFRAAMEFLDMSALPHGPGFFLRNLGVIRWFWMGGWVVGLFWVSQL